MSKRIKLAVAAMAILAAALLGFFIWRGRTGSVAEVYPVSNLNFFGDSYATMSGTIEAGKVQEVRLANSIVNEMRVKEGDKVNVGDVLMVYDTESYQITLLSDEAKIAVLEAQIHSAQREIERLSRLRPSEQGGGGGGGTRTIDHGALKLQDRITSDSQGQSGEEGGSDCDVVFLCSSDAVVSVEYLKELRSSKKTAEFKLYKEETVDGVDTQTCYGSWIVNGKNLFETILLNALSIKNDLDDTICNIPLWRWDSIWDGYIYEFDRTGKKARQTMSGQSVIGGLFFPCRLIQAKPDNGYIKDLKFQALYVPGITDIGYAKENSILDDYREAWVTIEPHATYKQVTENDVEKPKYHDINIGEASWLTIMQCLTMGMADEVNPSAAKQTKEELEKAKAVKKAKAKAKKQTNEYEYPPSNLADNPILNKFTELTITVFYRTVASKKAKVLMEAGKIQKRIPEKILEDNECKRIVKMCADSIKRGIWKLNQIQPLYVRNKPFDDDTKKTADLFGLAIQFSQTCEHMMFRPGGYIQQIAYADDKSAVYQKFLEEEVQTARNIWGKMRDTSRIVKHVEYESWLCGYIIADTWQRKGDENDQTGNTGFNPDISVNE